MLVLTHVERNTNYDYHIIAFPSIKLAKKSLMTFCYWQEYKQLIKLADRSMKENSASEGNFVTSIKIKTHICIDPLFHS